MEKEFKQFSENIRLTDNQEQGAKTKYEGVCKKLHSSYYDSDYDGSTKYLFGSYKIKTNIRPLTEHHDVDVLFKIPKEVYEKFKNYKSNGPSALLQEVKEFLNEKYTTTDEIKAWGKVVLIKFTGNQHNVEVLPAFENEDGTFTIPNSENGGSWDVFNPREQVELFQASNITTNGMTAELTRIIKTWVDNTTTLSYKPYKIGSDAMKFLEGEFNSGAEYSEYSVVARKFFEFLKKNCEKDVESFVDTALDRAKKACDFEIEEKPKEASEEWRKIFGQDFPLVKDNPVKESKARVFSNPSAPYGNYKAN